MKKTNETGRSMVEMLGVLAIIGVLSIGGIAGYTMAMNKYQANEIVNMIIQGAVYCRTKNYSSQQDITGQIDIDSNLLDKVYCESSLTGKVSFTFKDVNDDVKKGVCKALKIDTNGVCPGTLEYTPTS